MADDAALEAQAKAAGRDAFDAYFAEEDDQVERLLGALDTQQLRDIYCAASALTEDIAMRLEAR